MDHAGIDPNFQGGSNNPFAGGQGGFDMNMEDVFSQFFGSVKMGGMAQRRPSRGSDHEVRLTIDFHEAVQGTSKDVQVEIDAVCATCNGNGADPGYGATTCAQCKGVGQVTVSNGFMQMIQTCPACRGVGQTIEKL
jgi:molecular chaperone DnaJ